MEFFNRAIQLYRNQGFWSLLLRMFTYPYEIVVRNRLPRRHASYNGVTIFKNRLGDKYLPWRDVDNPMYESKLIDGIRKFATCGDKVIIVGGGLGISTVVAARQVGTEGQVMTYEASPSSARKVRETVGLNSVENRATIIESIVSEAKSTRGKMTAKRTVLPEELPDCDVLVLDCEGVEEDILKDYPSSPRAIVVETHGYLGTTCSTIISTLENRGYNAVNEGIADMSAKEFCEENGIYMIYAAKNR